MKKLNQSTAMIAHDNQYEKIHALHKSQVVTKPTTQAVLQKYKSQIKNQFLSNERLSHLQEIFKHYCNQNFKTGKHMTFDRVEYEKSHMTLECFLLFLRDFHLTTIQLNGKSKQIIPKKQILVIFKITSSTSKDLTIEQFILCIEKLAIIYHDESAGYFEQPKIDSQINNSNQKNQNLSVEMTASKGFITQIKSNQKHLAAENSKYQHESQHQNQQNYTNNDDLVTHYENLTKSKDKPRYQITEDKKKQNSQKKQSSKQKSEKSYKIQGLHKTSNSPTSNSHKIESFYKLIKIDKPQEYRNLLSDLTKKSEFNRIKLEQIKNKGPFALNDQRNQFKVKIKSKQSKSQKEKSQLRNSSLVQSSFMHSERLKKYMNSNQFNQKRVTWNELEKLSLQQLKVNKFYPQNLYQFEAEDQLYMGELNFDKSYIKRQKALKQMQELGELRNKQKQKQKQKEKLIQLENQKKLQNKLKLKNQQKQRYKKEYQKQLLEEIINRKVKYQLEMIKQKEEISKRERKQLIKINKSRQKSPFFKQKK